MFFMGSENAECLSGHLLLLNMVNCDLILRFGFTFSIHRIYEFFLYIVDSVIYLYS